MNFKEFMLENVKNAKDEEEIITFKGVETYKDKDGKPIPIKMRKMSKKEYRSIRKSFTEKTPSLDKKGNFVLSAGKRVFDEDVNNEAFNDDIIARCLVQPDLHDKDLLAYYGVCGATELLNIMFKGDDYDYVDKCCSMAIGFVDIDPNEVVEEIKN